MLEKIKPILQEAGDSEWGWDRTESGTGTI